MQPLLLLLTLLLPLRWLLRPLPTLLLLLRPLLRKLLTLLQPSNQIYLIRKEPAFGPVFLRLSLLRRAHLRANNRQHMKKPQKSVSNFWGSVQSGRSFYTTQKARFTSALPPAT
jgi:hypothetical protein